MASSRDEIISRLQKDILLLQGHRQPQDDDVVEMGLGPVRMAFPGGVFPVGAVHEFVSAGAEQAAATSGFIGGLLGNLMQRGGVSIWVSTTGMLFPPAMKYFGVSPDRIIFIYPKGEADALWIVEEALRCDGVAAVVGEVRELSFTASRRLQLAVEKSRVTGLILRNQPRNIGTTACVARWQIAPLASVLEDGLPGVGFPRWQVELQKIRNGRPGIWQMEWVAGRFQPTYESAAVSAPDVQIAAAYEQVVPSFARKIG
ncbi:Error-prone repair protein ImuA [Chitinophaga sp. 212800010-3]|uniref:ImuA family protein n=1 Tax=unclassified Chitinophaga TaxID=2619133 RepID=UPI002DE84B2E|nr:Protein ImuA [Chitinophaga sp. 212800010-3]